MMQIHMTHIEWFSGWCAAF